jgi:hypothetical protein
MRCPQFCASFFATPDGMLLPNPATRLGRLTRMFATIIGIESLLHGGVDMACVGEEILGGSDLDATGPLAARPPSGRSIRALSPIRDGRIGLKRPS